MRQAAKAHLFVAWAAALALSLGPARAAAPEDPALAAVATAAWLNQEVLGRRIDDLVVVAAPKSLGELRKHYHKALQAKLLGELAKDLTGHSVADIEAALAKA